MKKFIAIAAICLSTAGACTDGPTKEVDQSEKPDVGSAIACVRVGPTDEDPLMSNLVQLGYAVDYNGETWYYEGQAVGQSEHEDSGFDFCADPILMEDVMKERDAIIAAGGYGG